jgi:hypothetical protein
VPHSQGCISSGWTTRVLLPVMFALSVAERLPAQLPFYTDDPAVTERGKWHFEFFDELDALQHPQYPSLRQNTTNFKLNYGAPHNLEIDLDTPYLAIFRAVGAQTSTGMGDLDMGLKWNLHKSAQDSRVPALGVSLYIEFPTGDTRQQLGSGLVDYWLNFIAQEPVSESTRFNVNLGFLFAGNTSTGDVGIRTTRGHVYTGGLSILHDVNPRLTLGGEIYGGIADDSGLARTQFQVMLGGQYAIRNGMTLGFGLIGGRYVASPRIGGQVGFSVDFPDILRRAALRENPVP